MKMEQGIRLNRYLAMCGAGARRKVESLIAEGRVRVDGKVVLMPGYRVDDTVRVTVDGNPVAPEEKKYIVINKPSGWVCSVSDAFDPIIVDLLPETCRQYRLFPVGRLDREISRREIRLWMAGTELDGHFLKPLNVRVLEKEPGNRWVSVVIGEDAIPNDKNIVLENGIVKASPLVEEMINDFRKYSRGYGDIIMQASYDDEISGVLDYVIPKLGVKSVELKFGQAAKGIQGMARINTLEEALRLQEKGYIVYPDPSDPETAENFKNGKGPIFEKIGKLPIWNEGILKRRIAHLRELGAERICFKTGPFDPKDTIRILKIASENNVDLVTFDGAGGGTGNSPVKMMNEWGMPTVNLESMLYDILKRMDEKGYNLPQVAITGGFSLEDQIFKGLALGAPYIQFVAVGRAAMAAAMVGKQIGDLIEAGNIPKEYQRFGSTKEEIFADIRELRLYYEDADEISTGAVGVYSFINRVNAGIKQLMALNRKFDIKYVDRSDIFPLTDLAADVTGLDTYEDVYARELEKL